MAFSSQKKSQNILGGLFVSPALIWTLIFFVLPFCVMMIMSLAQRKGRKIIYDLDIDNYLAFFAKPHFVKALFVSLEITTIVTIISLLLAYPLAWIIAEKIPHRWQRSFLILAVLPFWTSYVVRSYSWQLVMAKNGVINNFLLDLGVIAEPLTMASTRFATVTGFVHFFVMLLTLTIYSNLIQLPKNYRKAAADLGANGFQVFRHIILPLTLPGIMVGAFLTFVLCIGDYITPQILGGNNELTMPQLIMLQMGRSANLPMAAAVSIILMGIVMLAYLLSSRWLKMDRL